MCFFLVLKFSGIVSIGDKLIVDCDVVEGLLVMMGERGVSNGMIDESGWCDEYRMGM